MRPNRLLSLLVVLLLALAGVAAASGWLRDTLDWPPTACEALPTVAEAEQILAAHPTELTAIEALAVSVSLDDRRCPGRAELLIAYATTDDRVAIRARLGDSFFALPYRLMNV